MRSICTPGEADQRADVRAARAEIELAERDVTDAKLALAPYAEVSTSLGVRGGSEVTGAPLTWSIQGLITIPIWDGGRYPAIRAARAQVEQQKARAGATVRAAELEQTQAQRSVAVAEQSRVIAAQARDLAAETARLTRVAFQAGTSTSFELVQASQRLREAELQLALREFEVVKAKITALLATASCRY
jgi:outer membrane protein TolC